MLADFGSISSWADNVDHSCILNHGSEPRWHHPASPDRPQRPGGADHRVRPDVGARLRRRRPDQATAAVQQPLDAAASQDGKTVVTLTSTAEIGSGAMQKLAERALCRVQVRQSDVSSPAWRTDGRSRVSDRPDIVILMTDEERSVPPYESPKLLGWRDRTLSARSGSTSTASAPSTITPARWPAPPAARPFSPGTTPTCMASPRAGAGVAAGSSDSSGCCSLDDKPVDLTAVYPATVLSRYRSIPLPWCSVTVWTRGA